MSFASKPNLLNHTALFRTTALAGSILIWGVLGYFTLTYVPKLVMPPTPIETVIIGEPPKPVEPPPPPIDIKRPEPVQNTAPVDPVIATPTLTTRPSQSNLNNPLQGVLPAGPAPTAPASGTGEGEAPLVVTIAPPEPIVAPPIIEPVTPPPAPRLIINPVRVSGNNPSFPPRALEREVTGEVTLSFTVSPNGQVENIEVTGEEPRGYGFARAAREAIAGWRFQPQTIDGVPVAYPARYTFSFKLED